MTDGAAPRYAPVLDGLLGGADARWAVLRDFVRGWRGPVESARVDTSPIATLELTAGAPLPSLRSWAAFHADLDAAGRFRASMRDEYRCTWSSALECYPVLLGAEGDVLWAIPAEHASEDDPPVVASELLEGPDHPSPPSWSAPEPVASQLTTFVLHHLLTYLRGAAGGFGVRLTDPSPYLRQIEPFVTSDVRLGGVRILEGDDLITWLEPTGSEPPLQVRIELGASWRDRVPHSLMDLGTSTGRRHGVFAPEFSRATAHALQWATPHPGEARSARRIDPTT